MMKRILVAIAGGVAGWLIGSLAVYATGWPTWVWICVGVFPAIALLLAERKRFIKTPDEMHRPVTLFEDSKDSGGTGNRRRD